MRFPYRFSCLIVFAGVLAACGQTGALYLPDEGVETPVEIRAPATTPPGAPTTEPASTPPAPVAEPDDDEKDPKDTSPPST